MADELLTPEEHRAVQMAGELWNLLTTIVGDGPAREGDLRELVAPIHEIQRAVLKQAAARAYRYRLLGGAPVPAPPEFVATTVTCSVCATCPYPRCISRNGHEGGHVLADPPSDIPDPTNPADLRVPSFDQVVDVDLDDISGEVLHLCSAEPGCTSDDHIFACPEAR